MNLGEGRINTEQPGPVSRAESSRGLGKKITLEKSIKKLISTLRKDKEGCQKGS